MMDEFSLPQKWPQWGPTFAAFFFFFFVGRVNVVCNIVCSILFLFKFYLIGLMQFNIVHRYDSTVTRSWAFNRKRTAVLNGFSSSYA